MSIQTRIEELDANLQPENRHKFTPEQLASMDEQLHNLAHIQMLWNDFMSVPINNCIEITEKPWHNFPAGTYRTTILRWFENEFHIDVAKDLMCEDENELSISTDNFKSYLANYVRSEFLRNDLAATDDTVNDIMSDIMNIPTMNVITKLVSIVSESIAYHKRAKTEYIVEMYDPHTDASYMQIETYAKQDDAVRLMNNAIGLRTKTQNDDSISIRVREIRYDADGNETETKTVNEKRADLT